MYAWKEGVSNVNAQGNFLLVYQIHDFTGFCYRIDSES
jgi:hypothetical protein